MEDIDHRVRTIEIWIPMFDRRIEAVERQVSEKLGRIEDKVDILSNQIAEFQGAREAGGNWISRGIQLVMVILALGGLFAGYLDLKYSRRSVLTSDMP